MYLEVMELSGAMKGAVRSSESSEGEVIKEAALMARDFFAASSRDWKSFMRLIFSSLRARTDFIIDSESCSIT